MYYADARVRVIHPVTSMRAMGGVLRLFAAALLLSLTACEGIGDNLLPSGEDRRPQVEAGTIGHLPEQIAADFAIPDSLGNTVRLSDQLQDGATPADAVVLYFTMWCVICSAHTDHLLDKVVPRFAGRGTVRYYLVDYVSGSVEATRSAELANGYAGSALTTLADIEQSVYDQFHAAMGTVVVIDATGTIHVNEDYRDGKALIAALDAILPP